jgi:RND family efflux transporter MFP subunit
MSRRTRIAVLIAAAGAAGLCAAALLPVFRTGPEPIEEPGIPVRVQAPIRDAVRVDLPYRGTVEGDRDATLSFRLGGELARIHVEEAREVVGGALLAELDASELDAALARAQVELERARTQEAHWEGELAVDERLFQAGAVSGSRLDATRLSHRTAVLARDGAEAGVAEIEARRDGARIRAPRSGTVGRVEVAEGESVLPGQPVLTLSGGERRVRVDVLEGDRARGIRPATPASLGEEGCPGRVTRVDATARPPFGATRVHVAPEGSCLEERAPGTALAVIFHLEGSGDALFVPLSAVDFRGGSPRIFRITTDGTAEAVAVALGSQRGDLQEVRGTLDPSDRVVVTGVTNLRAGDRVRVVEETPGGFR